MTMVPGGDNNNNVDDEEEDSEELRVNKKIKLRIRVKTVITTVTGTFTDSEQILVRSRLFHFSDPKNKHIKLENFLR